MGRQTGKKIAAVLICAVLLFLTGCSGESDRNDSQSNNRSEPKETKPLKQALEPRFIPNGIRSVSLKEDGEEVLRISREPAEYKMSFDYWEVLYPYDENATMDTEVMFELFELLCSFSFDTPVQVEEGSDTGIGDSDRSFSIEYVDTQDDSAAQSTDDADTRTEIILGNEDGNGGRYAAVAGDEEKVYILPEESVQMVYARKPFDYILKIPVLISADTLKELEITADGKQYKIQVDTSKDSYRFGRKEVEKEEFASLYQAISGIMLASETDQEKRSGTDESKLTVIFCRNMENAPDVRVSYYSYDDEFDVAAVDDAERFLVRKEEVDGVIEQIKKAF